MSAVLTKLGVFVSDSSLRKDWFSLYYHQAPKVDALMLLALWIPLSQPPYVDHFERLLDVFQIAACVPCVVRTS